MAISVGLTTAYAKAIYKDYTKKFADIKYPEYVEPVKVHAALNYDDATIKAALDIGNISQQEYDETMAYKQA